MKTLLALLLIPTILIGPFAVKRMMFEANEGAIIEGVAKDTAVRIQTIDLAADLLIAGFITVGFISAFLVFRFTFGRIYPTRLRLLHYLPLALAPTILFALTFFINTPSEILAIFSGVFGSAASGIIFGVSFIFGIIAHGMSSLIVSKE